MFGSYNSGRFRLPDLFTKGFWTNAASYVATATQDNFFASCWDDFQQYAAGTYSLLTVWMDQFGNPNAASPWWFYLIDYPYVWDDFESYAIGALTVLNRNNTGGGPPAGNWGADGGFYSCEYTSCYDDFESYAIGAITVLNGGGGAGAPTVGAWGANGGFV